MHDIPMSTVSQAFAACWQAAGRYLQARMQGAGNAWLKADLNPPFLEHLSFRLGNQLFFIRLEDEEGRLETPASRQALAYIASGCNGQACLMPMRLRSGHWVVSRPGWGLVSLDDGRPIDPPALVNGSLVEMTDWELHDFAVQVVRDQLRAAGHALVSWQGNPSVDPAIWIAGRAEPEWVVVRAARYPAGLPELPGNWRAIGEQCSRLGPTGHFAPVSVAGADGDHRTWRGHGLVVRFEGIREWPS